MGLKDNLESMLARGQDTALLRYALASELVKAGQSSEAIAHLRRALVLDPAYSAAWKLLGKALSADGQADEAVRTYRQGIDAATAGGDIQAAREMQVFMKRLQERS